MIKQHATMQNNLEHHAIRFGNQSGAIGHHANNLAIRATTRNTIWQSERSNLQPILNNLAIRGEQYAIIKNYLSANGAISYIPKQFGNQSSITQ